MASHLDCIGLMADSENEFQQLLSDVADGAENGPGAVIQGSCWMVGRLVNPATLT